MAELDNFAVSACPALNNRSEEICESNIFSDEPMNVDGPDCASQNTELTNLSADGASQNSSVTNLSADGASQNREVTNLSADGGSQNREVTNLSADGASQNREVTNLSADGASQNSIVTNLSADGASQNSVVTNLSADGASQNSVVSNLSADGASQNTEVTYLSADGTSQNTEVTDLSADGGLQSIEVTNLRIDGCGNGMDFTKKADENEVVQPAKYYKFENHTAIARFKGPHMKHFAGCKWSPDGTCLLTNCADYTLRIFDLPKDIHTKNNWNSSENMSELEPSLKMAEGGGIYDFAWYPLMSSWNPLTCCFISSSAGSPVHLWDAYTGRIRASYRAYDYADEVHSALSLAFSNDGIHIYCGFRNIVKVFDISIPGRDCSTMNLKVVSGQKGIVSCISVNPLMPELFAVGTYSKSIGLYTNTDEFICMLTGQQNGLTHLKFSNDGMRLFSGGRMDSEIICWDIRNPGTVLSTYERVVTTNQRIYFDLSLDDQYLISGGTDGICRVWDLHEETKLNREGKLKQCFKFKTHNDCMNSVSLNKSYPILATASGQYHYPQLTEDDDDEEIFSTKLSNNVENNVKLWWIGPISSDNENMSVDS